MEFVRYEGYERVGIITIERPAALNALNAAVLSELSDALDAVDVATTRALILTGAGEKAFVAGADVAAMQGMNRSEALAFSRLGNGVLLKLENFPLPVIAAVNGYALGGGCELALACDLRLASENAVFGQPETGLGVTPGFGGTQRLARCIGIGRAMELILSARNVRAEEALRIGLVNAVYPKETLLDEAKKLAARIAKNAPIAVRAAKKALRDGAELPVCEAVEIEESLFADCFSSEDQRAGMRAFLEKKPVEEFLNR